MSPSPALAERYGAPSPARRRLGIGVLGLVAAAFLGWLAWSALAHTDAEVRSDLLTFEVADEHTATARVDVRLGDDDVVATCLLRAIAEDHTVVGELSFGVTGADVADGTVLQREIRTERRATAVDLVGCTAPGQSRPQ